MSKVEGGREMVLYVVVDKAPLAGFGLSCLLISPSSYFHMLHFGTRLIDASSISLTQSISTLIQQQQHTTPATSQNQHIFHPQCSTNANAPQQRSSPPQPPTSPAAAPSNPSTHTQNPSSHPSTRPRNHPPSTPTRPHTSTPARGNATATTAPMPNPSTVPLLLLPGSAP